MMYQVVITAQATAAEFWAAAEWWANYRDADQAVRWFVEFDEKIHSLTKTPDRYAIADENDDFPYELRQLNFGLSSRSTHRAVFTIVEPGVVVVIAIRHLARDRIRPDEIDFPSGKN